MAKNKKPNDPGHTAQNGDVCGRDNDGDGHIENIYIKPHKRGDKKIQSHYRKLPKK